MFFKNTTKTKMFPPSSFIFVFVLETQPETKYNFVLVVYTYRWQLCFCMYICTPQIVDDHLVEDLERFTLRLEDPTAPAEVGRRSTCYINIIDEDSKNYFYICLLCQVWNRIQRSLAYLQYIYKLYIYIFSLKKK